MKIYHYKESNSPYWVVAFSLEKMTQAGLEQMHRWCYNAFGPGLGEFRVDNSPFVHRWVNDIKYGEIRFSEEKDIEWFLLNWQT